MRLTFVTVGRAVAPGGKVKAATFQRRLQWQRFVKLISFDFFPGLFRSHASLLKSSFYGYNLAEVLATQITKSTAAKEVNLSMFEIW